MQFLSYLINGISLGSVYALIALGYTMVYGIAKMLNFAHGDVIMIGSYVVFFAFGSAGMNPVLAIVLSMVVCTVLGVTIERVAYRPLREAPSLAVLITAIGVSYLLQQVAQLAWTSNPKSFISVVSGLKPISLFGGQLTISAETVVTIIACIVIMVVLIWFVNNTPAGHAMLAVSEDRGAAQLMGVNVNATISLTFAIGSALAAVAGALLCSSYPTLQPTTGAMPGIKAFVAAVFGGIGSIPGAFLGGILLGIIENLSKAYISTQLSDAIVFLVLVVVLIVKPTGLLVITDTMLNRVTLNWKKGKRTHVFIDEFHVVFENEFSAQFFNSAWRQFRKRNAYPTAITQNVEYLLDSVQASTMLSNSEFVVMLNQAASDRGQLAKLLNISNEQMSYITNADAGCGLIKYGSALVPFINRFPQNTKLYQLMTTRPGEGKFARGRD